MKTILLIEDNNEVRENTAEILELANYKVLQAEDGKVGVEKANSNHIDLIICDIIMRETDGYTVFKTLLQDISIQNIPFIFSTANSEESDREKANKIGFCEYLIKPFDGKELLDCVKRMLVKYKLA